MTTLIREDIQAAEAADVEHYAPLRGLPPLLSSSQVTSTTTARHDRQQSDGAESTDTENARRMGDLSMDEAKCSLVQDMLSCQGHPYLRCPPAEHGGRTPVEESNRGVDVIALLGQVSIYFQVFRFDSSTNRGIKYNQPCEVNQNLHIKAS